ncbi:phosphoribosylamine--glycine ligase [Halobacteriovorax marinus]|uniref:phosphoribosylamine--glycine ligase n=1 Tax=Halobacteriovorax marinus TaxID=97084 RepID=UPI003A918637
MKIAILGSGAREHALAWRILSDLSEGYVTVIPGNDGMSFNERIRCVSWDGEIESLLESLKNLEIEFVIIGPEDLLSRGVADSIRAIGIDVLGPSKVASMIESSKEFSKEFMHEYNIPTANFHIIKDYFKGIELIDSWKESSAPVVKASGLAKGKGVFVCESRDEAKESLYNLMRNDHYFLRENTILIEERLVGREVSAFALFDGKSYKTIGNCFDYKRRDEGDLGPNTGGMGAICSDSLISEEIQLEINEKVFDRFLEGMKKRGIEYKGVLFAGIILTDQGVKVIEFNARFGDPETQALMPCLKGNLLENLHLCSRGEMSSASGLVIEGSCVHTVVASGGYPFTEGEKAQFNCQIPICNLLGRNSIFYAGVKFEDFSLVNTGGRVLGISSFGDDLETARSEAYLSIPLVTFKGSQWREDIGLS